MHWDHSICVKKEIFGRFRTWPIVMIVQSYRKILATSGFEVEGKFNKMTILLYLLNGSMQSLNVFLLERL